MPIYEITSDGIHPLATTTFEQLRLRERADLQRLLRERIEVVAPDTMVLAEEFGNWEESRRRIDLLALDKEANLVVIELKRTADGGHMELQAIRYAAMVAGMTFAEAVEAHATYLKQIGRAGDAQTAILEFLGWEEPKEDDFAQDVRIVLVSADFGKELTTAVMWLNDRDLDIRCVRLIPYGANGLLDVQQIIPLPEAEAYRIRSKAKAGQERTFRRERSELQDKCYRFWTGLLAKARKRTDLHGGISASHNTWISAKVTPSLALNYAFGRHAPRVELYISTGETCRNKAAFDQIRNSQKDIEAALGVRLNWRRLDEAKASIVVLELPPASVRDEQGWPELQDQMIDAMIRFEAALRPAIERLQT